MTDYTRAILRLLQIADEPLTWEQIVRSVAQGEELNPILSAMSVIYNQHLVETCLLDKEHGKVTGYYMTALQKLAAI